MGRAKYTHVEHLCQLRVSAHASAIARSHSLASALRSLSHLSLSLSLRSHAHCACCIALCHSCVSS